MRWWVLISNALLLLTPAGAQSDQSFNVLVGQVRQKDGRTWEDLEVELYPDRGTSPARTVRTDADGRYRFENLPPGAYEIRLNLESSEEAAASFLAPAPLKVRFQQGSLLGPESLDFVLAYTPDFLKSKYKAEFTAFAQEDAQKFPAPGGLGFMGSSTIRLWETVKKDFAPLPVIHRGFGGSTMEEALPLIQDLVLQYRPRVIVVYQGDNDLRSETQSVQEFLDNCRTFIQRVQKALPQTKIYFLGIKPSIARWDRWPAMQQANQGLKAFAKEFPRVTFVDTAPPLLGPDGKPQPRFFADGLHLNPEGYAAWTKILKPLLLKEF